MNNSLRKECKGANAFNEETQEIFLVGKKATQRGTVEEKMSLSASL